jgi:hypothetical protein
VRTSPIRDLARDRLPVFTAAADQEQLGAEIRKTFGGGAAYPAIRPSDDANAARQVSEHVTASDQMSGEPGERGIEDRIQLGSAGAPGMDRSEGVASAGYGEKASTGGGTGM